MSDDDIYTDDDNDTPALAVLLLPLEATVYGYQLFTSFPDVPTAGTLYPVVVREHLARIDSLVGKAAVQCPGTLVDPTGYPILVPVGVLDSSEIYAALPRGMLGKHTEIARRIAWAIRNTQAGMVRQ